MRPSKQFDQQGETIWVISGIDIDPRRRSIEGTFRVREALRVAYAVDLNRAEVVNFQPENVPEIRIEKWGVPYSFVAISLTLASRWLLLSKQNRPESFSVATE